jgi:DNA-binding NarL/FixJ family response regulator
MERKRVILLCGQNLLGESLEHILTNARDVELIATWDFADVTVPRLAEQAPDLLVMTEGEFPQEQSTVLTAKILASLPDLPIIRVALEQNVFRVYTSRMLPARQTDLLDVIHLLAAQRVQGEFDDIPDEDGGEVYAL